MVSGRGNLREELAGGTAGEEQEKGPATGAEVERGGESGTAFRITETSTPRDRFDRGIRTVRSPSTGEVGELSSALCHLASPGRSPGGEALVGGLRMAQSFVHEPVMVEEVVSLFATVPAGVVLDGTVGGGGHSEAILAVHPGLSVLGLDRDPEAVQAARARLASYGSRATIRRARFGAMAGEVADWFSGAEPGGESGSGRSRRAPHGGVLSGVLLDLGVSSPQLDRPERGFSYGSDGPLDMRMDQSSGRSALDVVNTASEEELAILFAANGEGRLAGRLARSVVRARPLTTTAQLAGVVAAAVPAAVRRKGHPARRVFQALRIAVNEELEELAGALAVAPDLIVPGGRVVVIAYHSGEDRLVKAAFRAAARGNCQCPPGLPCVCGAMAEHQLVFRGAKRPSAAEVARNHRAPSARLRALERIEVAS